MDKMLIGALALWAMALAAIQWGPSPMSPEAAAEAKGRPAAYFPHDAHMSILDCTACHHRYDESGRNVVDEMELDGGDAMRCATCHDSRADVDGREAFHRQCMGCHIAEEKAGKPSGPKTCGACHLPVAPDDGLIIER
jgi:hypothetical protein